MKILENFPNNKVVQIEFQFLFSIFHVKRSGGWQTVKPYHMKPENPSSSETKDQLNNYHT